MKRKMRWNRWLAVLMAALMVVMVAGAVWADPETVDEPGVEGTAVTTGGGQQSGDEILSEGTGNGSAGDNETGGNTGDNNVVDDGAGSSAAGDNGAGGNTGANNVVNEGAGNSAAGGNGAGVDQANQTSGSTDAEIVDPAAAATLTPAPTPARCWRRMRSCCTSIYLFRQTGRYSTMRNSASAGPSISRSCHWQPSSAKKEIPSVRHPSY